MIAYHTFICSAPLEEGVDKVIPALNTTVVHYPSAASCFANNLISAVSGLGVTMTYNEETSELTVGQAKMELVYGKENIYLMFSSGRDSGACVLPVLHLVDDITISQTFTLCIKGTSLSFEVSVSGSDKVGLFVDFFGAYTFQRVHDSASNMAIRRNTEDGHFWVFENKQFVEHCQVIVPAPDYAISPHSHSGIAFVPAVTTDFAYRIFDAYMLSHIMASGTFYKIAGVSVVAVQNCVVLCC